MAAERRRASLRVRSSAGDAQGQPRGAAALHQPRDLVPIEVVGVELALAWPGPTALVLVLIVGVWAIAAGLVEIAAAFGHGEAAGTRALFILGGLITVAFGVVLCARPGVGAVTLALLFGLFSLIAGIWMLVQGIELRRTGKTLDPAAREKTPA